MKRYTFSEDLISKYPLLKRTQLLLSEKVGLDSVEDVITDLLPESPYLEDNQVTLLCLTVTLTHSIAYWDLIFEFPQGYYPYALLNYFQKQTLQVDDAFDFHMDSYPTLCKISFKVG